MNDTPLPTQLDRAWLDQAWQTHADAPERVTAALASLAASLPDDEDGAATVRLAEHVWLAHRHDARGLHDLLERVPAGDALLPAVQGALWAIALVEARPAPMLAEAVRWRSLTSAVLALVGLGRLDEARSLLMGEEPAAAGCADMAARRAYAAAANNVALDLRLGPRGDAVRDALMIDAATLARRAWEQAGTWQHVERADYQLAMCHAVLGQGPQALAHAHECLRRCEDAGADAVERFFAHEALARAYRACGESAAAHQAIAHMQQRLGEIADADTKAWCAQTLAELEAEAAG